MRRSIIKEASKLQEVKFTSIDLTTLNADILIQVAENLRDFLRDLIRHKDFQLKNKLQKQLNKIRNSGENDKAQKGRKQHKSIAQEKEVESDGEEFTEQRISIDSDAHRIRHKRNKRIKID